MDAKDLRLAQLEMLIRMIDEEFHFDEAPDIHLFLQKLLKETPEESLKVYNEYLRAINYTKSKPSIVRTSFVSTKLPWH